MMTNITFNIYQKGVNQKRWYISYRETYIGIIVKSINVTVNAISMPSASSIVNISASDFYLENFRILCPQGLAVFNKSHHRDEQLSCENKCPVDAYTFQAGSIVINGLKDNFVLTNMTCNRSKVHCKICPLGANCTGSIKALPNYWGYKDFQDEFVTMIRCHEQYCCNRNNTCDGINSCNMKRIGNLCGKCQKGFSETLFTTECLSTEKYIGVTVLLYYTVCVIIYAVFLAVYKDLEKIVAAKIAELYIKLKDQMFLSCKKKVTSNSNGHGKRHEENIEVNIQEETIDHCIQTERMKSENNSSPKASNVPDNKSDDNTKYIQILFYYIQDTTLFKVKVPRQTYQKKRTIEKILSFLPEIFTFIYMKVMHTCFSYTKTPVSKVLFRMLFGLYFLVITLLLYSILKITSKVLKNTSNMWAKYQSVC